MPAGRVQAIPDPSRQLAALSAACQLPAAASGDAVPVRDVTMGRPSRARVARMPQSGVADSSAPADTEGDAPPAPTPLDGACTRHLVGHSDRHTRAGTHE